MSSPAAYHPHPSEASSPGGSGFEKRRKLDHNPNNGGMGVGAPPSMGGAPPPGYHYPGGPPPPPPIHGAHQPQFYAPPPGAANSPGGGHGHGIPSPGGTIMGGPPPHPGYGYPGPPPNDSYHFSNHRGPPPPPGAYHDYPGPPPPMGAHYGAPPPGTPGMSPSPRGHHHPNGPGPAPIGGGGGGGDMNNFPPRAHLPPRFSHQYDYSRHPTKSHLQQLPTASSPNGGANGGNDSTPPRVTNALQPNTPQPPDTRSPEGSRNLNNFEERQPSSGGSGELTQPQQLQHPQQPSPQMQPPQMRQPPMGPPTPSAANNVPMPSPYSHHMPPGAMPPGTMPPGVPPGAMPPGMPMHHPHHQHPGAHHPGHPGAHHPGAYPPPSPHHPHYPHAGHPGHPQHHPHAGHPGAHPGHSGAHPHAGHPGAHPGHPAHHPHHPQHHPHHAQHHPGMPQFHLTPPGPPGSMMAPPGQQHPGGPPGMPPGGGQPGEIWPCEYCNIKFANWEDCSAHEATCPAAAYHHQHRSGMAGQHPGMPGQHQRGMDMSPGSMGPMGGMSPMSAGGMGGMGPMGGMSPMSAGSRNRSMKGRKMVLASFPNQGHLLMDENAEYAKNNDKDTYLLNTKADGESLSDRQCYVRSHFVELFVSSMQDVSSRHSRGAQKLHMNQIGLRCAYCVKLKPRDRAERAICYPSSISRIYQTVADMQRFHFESCVAIPPKVLRTYKSLKTTRPRGQGSPQSYWDKSAREIGLVDTEGGIQVNGQEGGEKKFEGQKKSVLTGMLLEQTGGHQGQGQQDQGAQNHQGQVQGRVQFKNKEVDLGTSLQRPHDPASTSASATAMSAVIVSSPGSDNTYKEEDEHTNNKEVKTSAAACLTPGGASVEAEEDANILLMLKKSPESPPRNTTTFRKEEEVVVAADEVAAV